MKIATKDIETEGIAVEQTTLGDKAIMWIYDRGMGAGRCIYLTPDELTDLIIQASAALGKIRNAEITPGYASS